METVLRSALLNQAEPLGVYGELASLNLYGGRPRTLWHAGRPAFTTQSR